MKAICPNCKYTFSVPAEFAGKAVKCPKCEKSVDVSENRSNSRFLLIAIISAALVGAIGFGLGVLSSRHSRKELQAAKAETVQLREEIKQLQTQIRQRKKSVAREELVAKQEAESEKRKEQESKKAGVDWRKLGFDNFARGVPLKGRSNC